MKNTDNRKKSKKGQLIASTLASLLASTSLHLTAKKAEAKSKHQGKGQGAKIECKGVATKWVNDCSATDANGYSHSCGGKAKTNFDPAEWLKMSKQDCEEVQAALKKPFVKKYVEMIQTGTARAVKRGKKL